MSSGSDYSATKQMGLVSSIIILLLLHFFSTKSNMEKNSKRWKYSEYRTESKKNAGVRSLRKFLQPVHLRLVLEESNWNF